MRLTWIHDLDVVLRHAWSVRFLVIATALDAAQTGVSFFSGTALVGPGTLVALNMGLALAALCARLVAQDTVSGTPGTFVENLEAVLRHAWSVRFLLLATVLDAAQTGVTFYSGTTLVGPGVLAGLNMGLALAALGARLVAQEAVSGPTPTEGSPS